MDNQRLPRCADRMIPRRPRSVRPAAGRRRAEYRAAGLSDHSCSHGTARRLRPAPADEHADIDFLAVGGPGLRGVIRRVARRRQRHHEVPAERPLREPLLQIRRQKIGAEPGQRGTRHLMRRLGGLHRPAHEMALSRGIDEAERVQAIVGLVCVARGPRRGLGPFEEGPALRVRADEGLQGGRVRLTGRRVDILGESQFVEGPRCRHDEDRHVVHTAAPLLAVGRHDAHRHAAHPAGGVRRARITDRDGKPSDHRVTPGREHRRGGKTRTGAVRLEFPGEADAFGMVPAMAERIAAPPAQRVDHFRRGQPVRAEPSRRVGEGGRAGADHERDDRERADRPSAELECSVRRFRHSNSSGGKGCADSPRGRLGARVAVTHRSRREPLP